MTKSRPPTTPPVVSDVPDADMAAYLIARYVDSWRVLLEYDEGELAFPDPCPAAALGHEAAMAAVADLKRDLETRNQASAIFGLTHDGKLEAILGNIEQNVFGAPVYPSREERAAHLLYFVVKDHPFVDGNKRIGSLLFLLYLAKQRCEHGVNPTALPAVTLLVAESDAGDKEMMIRFVANLLAIPADDMPLAPR